MLTRIIAVLLATALVAPTYGQNSPPFDNSEGGAVLCAWNMFIAVQAYTRGCALDPLPVDSAIDDAILSIDAFILANSSARPTPEQIDAGKKQIAAENFPIDEQPLLCETTNELSEFARSFREMGPERIREVTAVIVAKPREPVMNPCL